MKGKLLKYSLGALFLLVGLMVVAVVVLPLIVDPNDYKDEIATVVNEQTGRNLAIEGDISLSVFPWLGLDIGPTRLSNAKGFAAPDMASMDAVQIRIKLLPLLSKRLVVDTVKLSGLQLNLAKDKRGRTNWADMQGEGAAATEKKGKDSAGEEQEKGDVGLEGLAIGGVEVVDAQLVWDDRSSDSRYEINDLSFTTGAIKPGKRFDLDLHFQVAATQPAVSGTFGLKGGVLIAPSLKGIEISAAKLVLDVSGDTIPAGKMAVTLATDIAVDLDAQTLSMPEVVLEALGMNITGNISGTKITGDAPQFNGVFTVADFVPRELIKALGQKVPATADSAVLAHANARLEWTASAKDFSADVLHVRLDDTSLKGNARVAQFDAPAISFGLDVDQFDLDRYLPPATAGKAAKAAPETAPADREDAGELPVDALRALNLNGTLTVASLKAFNLHTTNVKVQIKASNGLLRINPAGAQLYNGEIRNDVTFDVRKQTPHFSLVNDVVKVQAGPLLHDLTGDEKLLGTAVAHASLSGSGISAAAVKRSLNGKASFSFANGAIKGVNIAELIRNAQAKLKGQAASAAAGPNQTDFAELSGSAVIKNGLVRNDDLRMSSPLLRITGKGEASLPKETIDYTLTTKIVGSLEGQGGAALGDLKGVAIPIHIAGTFSKPSYTPDLAAALSGVAKEKVQKKVEEQKQKMKEKLGNGLQKKLLKGLFN